MSAQTVEEANVALVTRFMEQFSEGDVEKTLEFMSEDMTWWIAGDVAGISGTWDKPSFKTMLEGVADNSKTGVIKMWPEDFTAQGERVAVETKSYGEMKNGKTYQNYYHFVFIVRDGVIQSVKDFSDTKHIQEVLAS